MYHLYSFTFYATGLDDMGKVRKALFMFVDLFGVERFEFETLVRRKINCYGEPRALSDMTVGRTDRRQK